VRLFGVLIPLALASVVAVAAPAAAGPQSAGRPAARFLPALSCSDQRAYPTPACVGVPVGTTLKKLKPNDGGAYRVTVDGTVLDSKHVLGDLVIAADNVVVRNSLIDGVVTNDVANDDVSRRFDISDSTVGPTTGCLTSPGVGESRYTARRVYVRGHDDGFRVSNNGSVDIADSFVRLCANPVSHADGLQAVCDRTCEGVLFNHNTVDARKVEATFMINLTDPHLGAVTVSDNLLMGGAYTMVTQWRSGPRWIVHDNRVVDKAWAYGPASAEGTCSHLDWSGDTIVRINANYRIVSTVRDLPCID
jgi:hypothetical protein